MNTNAKSTKEMVSELTETQRGNLNIIMEILKNVGAEYNVREVIMYIKKVLDWPKEQIEAKTGQELSQMIYNEIDRFYTP